jgi:hypothetical protein
MATNQTAAEAMEHAREWEALADQQEDTSFGRWRASTYRRTAEAFRLEAQTGVAHCVCCLKPTTAAHKQILPRK